MTPADTQAALAAATATLESPGDPLAWLHARDVVALVACVSALRDELSQTERERDEARALAALVTAYRAAEAAHLSAQRDLRATRAHEPRTRINAVIARAEAAQRAMLDAIEAIGGPPDVSESSAQCVEIRAKGVRRG